jgi:hypothetical protein
MWIRKGQKDPYKLSTQTGRLINNLEPNRNMRKDYETFLRLLEKELKKL